MTKRLPPDLHTRFFDQVLGEIEIGNTDQGISLLVGMLDVLHMQAHRLEPVRTELRAHMLHQLLLEEPLYRHAVRQPGDHAGLVRSICGTAGTGPISPTGARLATATANIPIIRALRQRRRFTDQKIAHAWRDGLKICILGRAAVEPGHALSGRDLSNVTLVDDSAEDLGGLTVQRGAAFDLICAPGTADTSDSGALETLFAALRQTLSPRGTALISALLPHHIGAGWMRVCLGWQPHVHAASTLIGLAADAGFTAQTCSDETNCIVWCVLRRTEYRPSGAGA